MEGAFCFVENQAIGAASDYGDCSGGISKFVSYAGYFEYARARRLCFFNEIGGAELVFSEGVDVRYRLAAGRLEGLSLYLCNMRLGDAGLLCR